MDRFPSELDASAPPWRALESHPLDLYFAAQRSRARVEGRRGPWEAIMWNWLRRIRGAIGMGFTWAVAWSAVGFVPRWVLGINSDLPFPILFGGLGFIAGVTFSGVLALTEGRRRFDQM